MSRFLITGLPRSKTAWMSVIASTVPGAICWHEPVTRFNRWDCCFDLWKDESYADVGIADSGLGFHLKRIIKDVNPKVLIICRDLVEVKQSLMALGGPQTNYVDLLAESLAKFMRHPRVGCIDFEDLQNKETVKQCLQFLMPGCVIDENRLSELMNLNIQVEMERIWEFALSSRSHLDAILGAEVMSGLLLSQ